jgi:hypothetical protein
MAGKDLLYRAENTLSDISNPAAEEVRMPHISRISSSLCVVMVLFLAKGFQAQGSCNCVPTPGTVYLMSPTNGAINQPSLLTLTWNSQSAVEVGYDVEVSTTSSFLSVITGSYGSPTSYIFNGLASGTTYYWRVDATSPDGSSGWSAVWVFTVENTSVIFSSENAQHQHFFINNGIISYSLNHEGPVDIIVCDILGKRLFDFNRMQPSGSYSLSLKNRDLPAGVYFLQFKAGMMQKRVKIVLTGG